MKEKDMAKADFITAIILIVFSISVVVLSFQMPRFEYRGANPWSVPGIVPGILGAIIGVLGIILLVRSIKRKGYRLDLSGKIAAQWFLKPMSIRLWLTILLTVFYAWGLIGRIPYPIATFLFIFVFIMVFEYSSQEKTVKKIKRLIIALVVAGISSAIISAVFQYGFLVRLP